MSNIQLEQLNQLSEQLKLLNIKDRKINIEAVGIRTDFYQNILPLVFDINVFHNQKNQYNEKITDKKSDCIFLDGNGMQYTTS